MLSISLTPPAPPCAECKRLTAVLDKADAEADAAWAAHYAIHNKAYAALLAHRATHREVA